MFSRVNYNGKIIKPVTNLYRNKAVCADITKQHNLTMGTDSLNLDTLKTSGVRTQPRGDYPSGYRSVA